jgi:hypothetical protein
VVGGFPGYEWLWSTGDTTQNIANLVVGTYSVIVTDLNGCTDTYSVTITQPSPITASVVVTDASACNIADGSIDLTPSGAVPPYYYNWSTGDSLQDISNLASGIYSVMVSDVSGCSVTIQIVVNNPSSPIATFNEPTDTVCSTLSTVSLSGFNPSGGTFSGPGVSGGLFYPPNANLGYNVIYYVYTDTATQCTGMAADSIYVDVCNSTPEETGELVNVFPNPTTGVLFLSIPNRCRVEVFSANGQKIKDEWLEGPGSSIDLSSEPEGIYIARIYTHETILTRKLVLVGR